MSIRAMLWAWDEAPVDDTVAAMILLALADEANDDGTDACPYKDKLIGRARKGERTVQSKLRDLYQMRLINFGDQAVAQRRYGKAPGHAPRAWNLNLSATKDNVPEPRSEEEMKLYARFMATGKVDVDEPGGVQKLPPTADQGKRPSGGVQKLPPTETPEGGVQKLPPTADQGKHTHRREGGVQPVAPFPIGSKPREKTSRFGSGSAATSGTLPGRATTGEIISFLIEDQEEAFALTDSENKAFWPTDLSDAEQDLFDECDSLAAARANWTPRNIRRVIGTPLIRKITAQNPALVRAAFLLAARDAGTETPRRLLHMAKCPLWATAAEQLEARARRRRELDSAAPGPQAASAVPAQSTGPAAAPARAMDNAALAEFKAKMAARNSGKSEVTDQRAAS
jgi:hypothetical protein